MTTTINLDLLNKARLRNKKSSESDSGGANIVPIHPGKGESKSPFQPIVSATEEAENKKEELKKIAEIKAIQDEAKIKSEEEKRKLLETQMKTAENERRLEEEKAKTQAVSDARIAKEAEFKRESIEKEKEILRKENEESLEHKKQLQLLDEQKKEASKARVWKWLKMILTTLLLLILIGFLLILLFRAYRWAVEEPIIKEVEKVVIKEVVVEKESEVAVIAPNCIKLKEGGETLFNCAGISYRVNTLSELTKEQINEIKSTLNISDK